MDFSEALRLLKSGKRITRRGWSGQGQWLEIQESLPDGFPQAIGSMCENGIREWYYKPTLPFIIVHMSSGHVVPWTASQKDVLFDDWEIVDE